MRIVVLAHFLEGAALLSQVSTTVESVFISGFLAQWRTNERFSAVLCSQP